MSQMGSFAENRTEQGCCRLPLKAEITGFVGWAKRKRAHRPHVINAMAGTARRLTGVSILNYSPCPCAITLRMTFGNASSLSIAILTQRMPFGARVRAGTLAV
jgi:hypothetical protein